MKVLTVDYRSASAPASFCQSLKETGFGVLTNHTISKELIADVYHQWEAFFADEDKFNYLYQKPSQDGYFPFRSENAKDHKISDLKEFFHFYPWGKRPEKTRELSMRLFAELNQLASELLRWIEHYLPRPVADKLAMPLQDMITNAPNTLLRILHYPPLIKEREDGAVRAAAHEDINLITLLPAATTPGLEVLDANGNWYAVSCDVGNVVVNVGDMLQECTQQYYKSTTHRVVNPSGDEASTSRYSMPLFLHPRGNVRLSDTYTAEQYLHHRLRQIGIY